MLDNAPFPEFVQASRVLRVSSPLGDDVLLPERAQIFEGVNALFEITVVVRSKKDIVAGDLIGKAVDIELEIGQSEEDGEPLYRPFNGIVTELHEGPAVSRGLRSYHFVVRPSLWLLSQTRDSRIWLGKSTLDVLETLLSEHGLKHADADGVLNPAPAWDYSCQFNESDLRYLLRRFEQDGYFWWFSHEKGAHTLHVANHAAGWLDPSTAAQGESRVRLARGSSDRNHITEWMRRFSYVPGKRTGADWNYKTFGTIPMDSTPSLVELPDNHRREVFEWPARAMNHGEAEEAERLRSQASEADHERVSGASAVRFLEAGRRFQPYDVANPDAEYEEHIIVRAEHVVVDRSYETGNSEPEYRNSFEAIPSRIALTPHRETPRPRIEGLQVAVVAGPDGEEIHCDSDGCIKLWFPWQRHRAKKDGSDTKWIRVATNWAGQGWGGQVIPRIGMEVLVAFLDSDPDRPIVVGLVPNPKNKVPYELPQHKTRSVFKTQTHKGAGFNELRFEDKQGREEIFIHAQRDLNSVVEHDETRLIKQDRLSRVGGNDELRIDGMQSTDIVGAYNVTIGGSYIQSVGLLAAIPPVAQLFYHADQTAALMKLSANYATRVPMPSTGNYTLNVRGDIQVFTGESYRLFSGSDVSFQADGSADLMAAGLLHLSSARTMSVASGANIEVSAERKISIESGETFTLKCGASSITLTPEGHIEIKGQTISLRSGVSAPLDNKGVNE